MTPPCSLPLKSRSLLPSLAPLLLLQVYSSGQALPGAQDVPTGYRAISSIDAFRKQAAFW